MKAIHKVLVIRLSALGDICMTLPIIGSACLAYPNVEFTLLTSKPGAIVAATALQQYPNFKVRSINKRDYNGIHGLNRLYAELKSLQFDAVADLHHVIRSQWVSMRFRLAGKTVRHIEKGRTEKSSLVAHSIWRQLTPGVERYRKVFAELGMNFDVNFDAKALGRALRHGMESEPQAIGIAPFAQHQGKVYPSQQMCRVIELLLERRPDLHIYLFGGREDQPVLDVWAAAHPQQVTSMAGRQSLDQDLKLMARLRLMLSMDSANMHLASLVGLRCFSIWGATHRYAGFLGFGQQEADCLELPLSCRPCSVYGNKPCQRGDWQCLTSLKPETVAEALLNAMS